MQSTHHQFSLLARGHWTFDTRFGAPIDGVNTALDVLTHAHCACGLRSRRPSAEVTIEAQAAAEVESETSDSAGAAVRSGQCMCMHFCTVFPSESAGAGEAAGGGGVLALLAGYEDGKVAVYTQAPGGRWQPGVCVKLHEEPVLSIAEATVRRHR